MEESVLFPFKKIRVKPRTVLIETVLSGDPCINLLRQLNLKSTYYVCMMYFIFQKGN